MKGYAYDNGFFVFADGLVTASDVSEILIVHDRAAVIKRDKGLPTYFRPLLPQHEENYRPMSMDGMPTGITRPEELEFPVERVMMAQQEYNRVVEEKYDPTDPRLLMPEKRRFNPKGST